MSHLVLIAYSVSLYWPRVQIVIEASNFLLLVYYYLWFPLYQKESMLNLYLLNPQVVWFHRDLIVQLYLNSIASLASCSLSRIFNVTLGADFHQQVVTAWIWVVWQNQYLQYRQHSRPIEVLSAAFENRMDRDNLMLQSLNVAEIVCRFEPCLKFFF